MRHTLAILLTTLLSCATAWGQPVLSLPPYIKVIGENDTLPAVSDDELFDNGIAVYFKVNSTRFASTDKGFLQLRYDLTHIPEGYKFCQLIVLRGSASPEGPADNNRRLAHQRARALTDSLRKYVTLPESTIVERFINEDYAGLQRLMVASDEPYRDDVLNALDLSQTDAANKKRLQALHGGTTWKLLLRDYFPRLRATRVIMVISRNPDEWKPIDMPPIVVTTHPVKANIPVPPLTPLPAVEERYFKPWIAVNTNLPYDAVMTPNIEIERWFGKDARWSVMAEWNFPWWQWHHKERVYEVNEIGLELRRWAPQRMLAYHSRYGVDEFHPLIGRFIGIYLAGGNYDLEWRYHGEQGDIYSAGITYGYSIRLSRHWNMEFSASAGYLYSPYTHYEAENHDDILFGKYKKHVSYIGPTKLKVSLSWLIGKTKKRIF